MEPNHRLRRPGNLLFAQPEVLKLADFGCATLAPESITLEEQLICHSWVGWLVGWLESSRVYWVEILNWEEIGV